MEKVGVNHRIKYSLIELIDKTYSLADPGKSAFVSRRELRRALEQKVETIKLVFEKRPLSTTPTIADKVMRQLDLTDNNDISKAILIDALTQTAMSNGKFIKSDAITALAGSLIGKSLIGFSKSKGRDEIRSILEAFNGLLEIEIDQSATRNPVIDDVMLELEDLDEGKVSDQELQDTMVRVFEQHKLKLDPLSNFIGAIYTTDLIEEGVSR